MAIKMVPVDDDLYDRVMSLKRGDAESFSQVLRRSLPDQGLGVPALELLRMNEEEGGILKTTPEQLDAIEQFRKETNVWRDPWTS